MEARAVVTAGREQDAPGRQLALWVAEEGSEGDFAGGAHRTICPVYAPDREDARLAEACWDGVDWAAIVAEEVRSIEVPESERAWFAGSYTLRGLYEDRVYGLAGLRSDRVAAGKLAANTRAKDLQALNRWERFSPRPPAWPAGRAWEGRPLGWVTDKYCTATLTAMHSGGLSWPTVRSTWNHLRTIFNWAVQIRVLERSPDPEWGKRAAEAGSKQMYTDRQLGEIYLALTGQTDLQVAFVVSCNVGCRSVDLFLLRWENFLVSRERPVVEFTARKTGKQQTVPLGPVTVRQLERWRAESGTLGGASLAAAARHGGLVWPGLTDPDAADPERSRPARRRNARLKEALLRLDPPLDHAKPWQVGRLTCNERLERWRPGSGQFVLGHVRTLNSVSYREPSGLIYEAVTSLPQPDEWS